MTERDIFLALLELPDPAARAAHLDAACAGRPELRAAVLALLAAHEASGILDRPADPAIQTVDSEPGPADPALTGEHRPQLEDTTAPQPTTTEHRPHAGPGVVIAGRYVLERKLGEGGMGEVWDARQTEPVKRKVALKLIKAGMDSQAVLQRFEQERQALALMDHPNIARVLDGGPTPTGQPFFVMELVNGLPLTRFCDEAKLTPRQRLELFVPICQAVQHAHQKGVVHRDLKPANILVTLIDGRPVPKVIDFGVAKATAGKLTDESLATQFGAVVGTLEYMAPEQAGYAGEDIDTRADIYSLGVILYEVLTGLRPVDAKHLKKAGLVEMIRVLREEEPARPSTRLSAEASLPSLAAVRQIEPRKLIAMLRGELDWVVMKCLEKQRDRRYDTANGLAREVQRFLTDEPVEARPPSAGYRVRKFVRRHKGQVIAAGLVLLVLVGGIVGTSIGMALAIKARQRAEDAEAETRSQAEELKMVSDFQADMLKQVDPTRAGHLLTQDVLDKFQSALGKANVPEKERPGLVKAFRQQWSRVNATDAARELIASTILKPAALAIDKQFQDQPLVDAQLRQSLANRYKELSLYDAARPLQEVALATRRRVLGDKHPDTLASRNSMGTLLQFQGKYAEAEGHLREALEGRRRTLGEDHPDTLESLSNLGDNCRDQSNFGEAETLYREALEKSRRVIGEDDDRTITLISMIGVMLHNQRKLAEAEPYLRETLDRRRRLLGDADPSTLIAVGNLGNLLRDEGKMAEAEAYLREALEGRRRVLGEDHMLTLNSINNLGVLLAAQGKLAEAEGYYREAVGKLQRVLGEEHPNTLVAISSLGRILMEQGKLSEAERFTREAVEKRQRLLGKDDRGTLLSVMNLGTLLLAQNKLAETIALLTADEGRFRKAFVGVDVGRLAQVLFVLGKARAGASQFAAAEGNLLEAHGILSKKPGASAKVTVDCTRALADLYAAWDRAEPGKGHDAKAAAWKTKLLRKAPAPPQDKK